MRLFGNDRITMNYNEIVSKSKSIEYTNNQTCEVYFLKPGNNNIFCLCCCFSLTIQNVRNNIKT
jgi:hypothetical protein